MPRAPWTEAKLPDGTTVQGIVNLPAALIVLLLTAMLIGGTGESARLNNVMVGIKLAVVLAFIVFGIGYVTPANWHPFIPEQHRHLRSVRLDGRDARRLGGVLRLHRLRCGFDRGAGSQAPADSTCRSASSARC